jgi:hypothetical protein
MSREEQCNIPRYLSINTSITLPNVNLFHSCFDFQIRGSVTDDGARFFAERDSRRVT